MLSGKCILRQVTYAKREWLIKSYDITTQKLGKNGLAHNFDPVSLLKTHAQPNRKSGFK